MSDFKQPTEADFERLSSPQEIRLWEDYLKDKAPAHFQRSIMADMDHFLFLCPDANLVVELVKFRHFSDSAGTGSGKKGDALRSMGLKLITFTYRETEADFDGVCGQIAHAVERALGQKSLVDIPHRKRLPLDDDNTVKPHQGYHVTVSGDYKLEGREDFAKRKEAESDGLFHGNADLLKHISTDVGGTYGGNARILENFDTGVPTYGGNAGITDSLGGSDVPTYGGNAGITESLGKFSKSDKAEMSTYGGNSGILKNDDTKAPDGYGYERFNKRGVPDIPLKGNWQRLKAEKAAEKEAEAKADKPGESEGAGAPTAPPKPAAPAPEKCDLDRDTAVKKNGAPGPTPAAKAALAAAGEREKERPEMNDTKTSDPKKSDKHIFIAKGAVIVGDVRVGDDSSIWFGAVLRGDQAPITIGDGTNVQDGTVVHVDLKTPTIVGDGVTIGHNCTIHGCDIGDNVLIGMGSTIMNRAEIPDNCIVGAGSLVTQGKSFPEGSLIMGSPAKAVRKLTDEEIQGIRDNGEEYRRLMDLYEGEPFEAIPGGFVKLIDD
jgi:carbonic anhydrase/acetyltransferase-like protein (isoleucine patch superfamily)/very-short-patch-repair endonuclease